MDFVLITTDTHAMLDKRIIEQSTQTNTNSNKEHYAMIIHYGLITVFHCGIELRIHSVVVCIVFVVV